MLAGNIVQVRLERKALSAAVGPTCCSGREQRSKTAFAGSAIPLQMQATRQLRVERRALREQDHRHRSLAAARAIMRLRFFRAGKRVALYLPFDGESDTAALIAAAQRRGVQVFVPGHQSPASCPPALLPADWRHRTRRVWDFGSTPALDPRLASVAGSHRHPSLVGVDAKGRRLGLGGGYYDRALAFRRRRRCWKGPHLVGLAFDCRRTKVKFADTWDLRLDSLATELGVEHFL
jgi:5-formyltetrahydrofolate cyclo-ligase